MITSSPALMPMASSARCKPAVAELTEMASQSPPTNAAKSDSKRLVLGPVVTQPERRESTTSVISASSMSGRAKGRKGFVVIMLLLWVFLSK